MDFNNKILSGRQERAGQKIIIIDKYHNNFYQI